MPHWLGIEEGAHCPEGLHQELGKALGSGMEGWGV